MLYALDKLIKLTDRFIGQVDVTSWLSQLEEN